MRRRCPPSRPRAGAHCERRPAARRRSPPPSGGGARSTRSDEPGGGFLMTAVLPGATLGVVGGGQLGRMFAHAAQRMGYLTAVLDPDADSPAGRVSHHHIHTDYADVDGLARLA